MKLQKECFKDDIQKKEKCLFKSIASLITIGHKTEPSSHSTECWNTMGRRIFSTFIQSKYFLVFENVSLIFSF